MKRIKKIDIHAHVVPKSIQTRLDFLNEDELFRIYDELRVEKSVILPFLRTGKSAVDASNENAMLAVQAYPERFARFVSVELIDNDIDLYFFLKAQKDNGAVGVGEITSNIYFDDSRVDNLLSACEKLDMPVLAHISPALGKGYGLVDDLGLPRLEKILQAHPNLKFIGHSKPFWSEIAILRSEEERSQAISGKIKEGRLPYLLRKYGNLYCDLSAGSGANAMMRDREYTIEFMNEFQDRLLYGTDICSLNSTFPYTFSAFLDKLCESGEISFSVYKKICRDNAIRLLKLQ